MKVGIFCIQPDMDANPARVAAHAEALGFNSYWAPDHIILPAKYETKYPGNPGDGPDPDYLWKMPDPLIALMHAATATTTLQIGTAVLLVPERHPLHLAKEVASLDSFSGGRFHFGIGAGWNREECEIFGGDFDHRWSQVREAVEVMKTCWVDDESEHHGKYYDFPPVKCYPKPAQRPHPPVYLPSIMFGDSWAKRVFRRIVRWGDGWLPVVANVDQIVDGVNQIREIQAEEGKEDKHIRVTVLGGEDQWRTRRELDAFEGSGAEEVLIWIKAPKLDGILSELDALAAELL
ncbi:MAG: LLM class F420-dependent oxidoreductase [Gammaproteobacteria bacterium]